MVTWVRGGITESGWEWLTKVHKVPVEADLDREIISISFQEDDLIHLLRRGIVVIEVDGELVVIGLDLLKEKEIEELKHENLES